MSIPALRLLRAAAPEAHIALASPAWAKGIFEDADFIDEIIVIDSNGGSIGSMKRRASRFRDGQFDAAILFTNSFRTALVARAAGIPKRFGYGSEARGFLLSTSVPKPAWKNERHESEYYVHLVMTAATELGLDVPEAKQELSLAVSGSRRAEARSLLESAGILPGERFAAIGAGSTNSRAKRWPAVRFAKLSEDITGRFGLRSVLLGSEEEQEVAAAVVAASEAPTIDLTGMTSLSNAVAILAEADVMVSNDMGLAHVAAAVGTPTVTIFGPTNPLTTSPIGSRIVREPVECSPCMLRDCPIDHRCMTRIDEARVLEILAEELNKTDQ